MGKSGVLRGRGQFRTVLSGGRRVYGRHLRAAYLRTDEPGEPVRVGIAVPRRIGGAVIRNRIRRLIREAVRRETGTLREHLHGQEGCIDVVISFSSDRVVSLRRLSLHDILPDVKVIVRHIAARPGRDRS